MFTPTLVKVLRYFRDHSGGVTRQLLTITIQADQKYVDLVLERLTAANILAVQGGRYESLPSLLEFSDKMFRLYDRINRRTQRELLVRGLLCAVKERGYLMSQESLLKLLEEDGFEREETASFIAEEVNKGYIGKIRVSVGSRRAGVLPPLPCLPLSDLRPADLGEYDDYRENRRDRGATVWEGDYLIANYPVELAAPAMLFLDAEGSDTKMRLREETLHAWSRYRSGDASQP